MLTNTDNWKLGGVANKKNSDKRVGGGEVVDPLNSAEIICGQSLMHGPLQPAGA